MRHNFIYHYSHFLSRVPESRLPAISFMVAAVRGDLANSFCKRKGKNYMAVSETYYCLLTNQTCTGAFQRTLFKKSVQNQNLLGLNIFGSCTHCYQNFWIYFQYYKFSVTNMIWMSDKNIFTVLYNNSLWALFTRREGRQKHINAQHESNDHTNFGSLLRLSS